MLLIFRECATFALASQQDNLLHPRATLPMTKATDQIAGSETSIKRGLDFIYRVASTADGFDSYGSLLICCFALVGATSREASLRQLARSRAQKLAQRWGRAYPIFPPDASPDLVLDF